jgi:hypothetical protein
MHDNIIQIHNSAMWDRQYSMEYFPHSDIMWKYMEIFCGILSVPHNTIMDLNNVMNTILNITSNFLGSPTTI